MTEHNSSDPVEVFWESYLATLPPEERDRHTVRPPAWGFGDGGEMADELGELVRSGRKTATCSLFWEYEVTGETPPTVGARSIILNGNGQPLCIIETTEVTIRPFNEVPEDFARDEGEGDLSLENWREGHWRYFSRLCETLQLQPDPTMPLVCERFRLVFSKK